MLRENIRRIGFVFIAILICNINIIVAQTTEGQSVDSLLLKAKNYYENFQNQEAVEVYLEIFTVDPVNAKAKIGIAESYFAMNDYTAAERWYHVALEDGVELGPDNYYEYGLSLIANRRYHEAEALFTEYDDSHEQPLTEKIMNALQNIHEYLKDSSNVEITNLSINTEEKDFFPYYHDNGIYFISSRVREENFQPLNLFYSKEDGVKFGKPDHIMNDVNQKFHVDQKIFFDNDNKILYVLNKGKDNGESGFPPMEIYQAQSTSKRHKWKKPRAVPVNSKGFANFQPTISSDGQTIYFISDRPGGEGGTDIYYSKLEGETWSEPRNMGPKVNSPGNELYPFLYNDQTLFFSSDGIEGLGGLDIFRLNLGRGDAAEPVNMGFPINSTYDDFALVTKNGNDGLFSSNRLGGQGDDDLYHYQRVNAPTSELLTAIVRQKSTSPVANSNVNLYTLDSQRALTVGEASSLEIDLPTGTAYALVSDENGSSCISAGIASSDEAASPMVCQEMSDEDQIHVVGFAVDRLTKEPMTTAHYEVLQEEDLVSVAHEANNSVVAFRAEKGKNYIIRIREYGYAPFETLLKPSPNINGKIQRETFNLEKTIQKLDYASRIIDNETGEPISGATVIVSSSKGEDIELVSDESGNVNYKLYPDDQFLVLVTTDDKSGMLTGVASALETSDHVTHLVKADDLSGENENQLNVVGFISAEDTNQPMEVSGINIYDKESKELVSFEYGDGILNFKGEKGKTYVASLQQYGYETLESEIEIPVSESEKIKKLDFVMRRSQSLLAYQARIYDGETLENQKNAKVNISSFKTEDKVYSSNADGLVDFNVKPGEPFIMMVEKEGKTALYTGAGSKNEQQSMMIHQVALSTPVENQIQVAGIIADNLTGEPLKNALITIKEKNEESAITYDFNDGVLAFNAEKGKSYQLNIKHEGYEDSKLEIEIDPDSPYIKFNAGMIRSVGELLYAGKILDVDNYEVSGSEIMISSFNSPDVVVKSNDNGNFDYRLKPGDTYLALASKGSRSGMLFGEATKESSSAYEVHEIEMTGDGRDLLVIGMVGDGVSGRPLKDYEITITDTSTGKPVKIIHESGMIHFQGRKNTTYLANIKKEGYQELEKEFVASASGNNVAKLDFAVNRLPDEAPSQFAGENFGVERKVLVFKNVSDDNQMWEMVGQEMYNVTNDPGYVGIKNLVRKMAIPVNKESLDRVLNDATAETVVIHNVFYEFDSKDISDEGKSQLNELAALLKSNNSINLEIHSFTDSRGSARYNKNLSARRSGTVKRYLTSEGVSGSRIITVNKGEESLVNNCVDGVECNEEAHSVNRRTEFFLIIKK